MQILARDRTQYPRAYGKGGPGDPWTPQSTFLPHPLGAFLVNSVGSFWEEEREKEIEEEDRV